MSRYNEGVHSIGSHIVYNYWYIKSHLTFGRMVASYSRNMLSKF